MLLLQYQQADTYNDPSGEFQQQHHEIIEDIK
jgi:hypothetical protein